MPKDYQSYVAEITSQLILGRATWSRMKRCSPL